MSDPIASLHKMSPTAGAANQEYVAINPVAVAAMILGLLSAVCVFLLLLVKLLLVLPILGVACAIIAIRQIRHSGGTQTGIGVAAVGLVLSLIISGIVLTWAVTGYRQEQRDGQQINAVLQQFGQDMHKAYPEPGKPGDSMALADGYMLFTPDFQSQFDARAFTLRMAQFTGHFGQIDSIKWNGICHFAGPEGNDHSAAETMALITILLPDADGALRPNDGRFKVVCRQTPSGWRIDSIPELFVPPQPPPHAVNADTGR